MRRRRRRPAAQPRNAAKDAATAGHDDGVADGPADRHRPPSPPATTTPVGAGTERDTRTGGRRKTPGGGDRTGRRAPSRTPQPAAIDTAAAVAVSAVSILVYLYPMLCGGFNQEPVLDELFLFPNARHEVNADAMGTSPLSNLLTNDYWGRSMDSGYSHKSWRPFAVWTIRLVAQIVAFMNGSVLGGGKGGHAVSLVVAQRAVNVFLHVALALLVGRASTLLLSHHHPPPDDTANVGARRTGRMRLQSSLASLLFALHPAHVECVANAANRPHLLALACSLVAATAGLLRVDDPDDDTGMMNDLSWLVFPVVVLGLTSCEAAVFQVPAILVTSTVVAWNRTERTPSSLRRTVRSLLPRHLLVVHLTCTYLVCRWAFFDGATSIPTDLLRKHEVPFKDLGGWSRFVNYSYVASVHVYKSLGVELVGPDSPGGGGGWPRWFFGARGTSHEYGYDCIPEIDVDSGDARLLAPLGLLLAALGAAAYCLVGGWGRSRHDGGDVGRVMTFLVVVSWYLTLFPACGILTVGTFVADRLVLPCTVAVCALGGGILARWLLPPPPPDRDADVDVDADADAAAGFGIVRGTAGSAAADDSPDRDCRRGRGCPARRGAVAVVGGARTPPSSNLLLAIRVMIVGAGLVRMGRETARRTADWTGGSVRLFKSSLATCPRGAKILLQLSRFYTRGEGGGVGIWIGIEGNNGDDILGGVSSDLDLALSYAKRAEKVDPDYCHVHIQVAKNLLLQRQQQHQQKHQGKWIEVEERLARAMSCPPTHRQATKLWNTYWRQLDGDDDDAMRRKEDYRRVIDEASRRRDRRPQLDRDEYVY